MFDPGADVRTGEDHRDHEVAELFAAYVKVSAPPRRAKFQETVDHRERRHLIRGIGGDVFAENLAALGEHHLREQIHQIISTVSQCGSRLPFLDYSTPPRIVEAKVDAGVDDRADS